MLQHEVRCRTTWWTGENAPAKYWKAFFHLTHNNIQKGFSKPFLLDQMVTNLNFSGCDVSKLIFLSCHFCFNQPEEVVVSSSSGVQMDYQRLFTLPVSVRCLVRSGQGGILSIRVIYERPYWACYAWAKTGSFLLCIEGHLRVDYMKKIRKLHKYSLLYQISSWLSSIYNNLHSISLNELYLPNNFLPIFHCMPLTKNCFQTQSSQVLLYHKKQTLLNSLCSF